MLTDIFKNRLFVGALAFFVLCVAGSLLYMHHEIQKGAEYTAETEDRVRQWNAKQKEQLPTETPVVEKPAEGGHTHADRTHEAPAQLTPPAPADDAGDLVPRPGSFLEKYLSRFSPAEAKRAMSGWFEQAGVPPPPRGYEYIWDDAWVVKRDADGNPVINKIGEPYIQVYEGRGFAPNPEQARRYAELEAQWRHSFEKNERARILSEMDRLINETQGPFPRVSAFASGKKAQSKVTQRMKEAREKALVDFGLGHLVGTGIGGERPRSTGSVDD